MTESTWLNGSEYKQHEEFIDETVLSICLFQLLFESKKQVWLTV